jgi:hypothetical protein
VANYVIEVCKFWTLVVPLPCRDMEREYMVTLIKSKALNTLYEKDGQQASHVSWKVPWWILCYTMVTVHIGARAAPSLIVARLEFVQNDRIGCISYSN